jgi:hypothetical protein
MWFPMAVYAPKTTLVSRDETAWFDAQWVSSTKSHDRRGACLGEYDQDLDVAIEDPERIKGELELDVSFISDKRSSNRCFESDDFTASLTILFKFTGSYSDHSDSIVLDAVLKKCEEDGSFHECDSTPRTAQFTLRKSGADSVVLEGSLYGSDRHKLERYKKR